MADLARTHLQVPLRETCRASRLVVSVKFTVTARAPNRDLHVQGDRNAYIRNGATGTITAINHNPKDTSTDTITVDSDDIGSIEVPRACFDLHRTIGDRPEVGIDHAYALTSYAVQGSTRSVSTSRVDATATRAETYVDITRGRNANHLYLTAAPNPSTAKPSPASPHHPPTKPPPTASTDPPANSPPGSSPTRQRRRP
jgi:hypothetical protein